MYVSVAYVNGITVLLLWQHWGGDDVEVLLAIYNVIPTTKTTPIAHEKGVTPCIL